jgi:hypothetical protein
MYLAEHIEAQNAPLPFIAQTVGLKWLCCEELHNGLYTKVIKYAG